MFDENAQQGAAANRRPAGQSNGLKEFQRNCCSRSASPAAVASVVNLAFNP